jgi:hypothetical protein
MRINSCNNSYGSIRWICASFCVAKGVSHNWGLEIADCVDLLG